jgi:hypothetical protein
MNESEKINKRIDRKEIKMSKQLLFCMVKSGLFNDYSEMITYKHRTDEALEVMENLAQGKYDEMIKEAIPDEITFHNYFYAVYIIRDDLLNYGRIVTEISFPTPAEAKENEMDNESRIKVILGIE